VWQRLFRSRLRAPLLDEESGLAGIEYLLQRLSEELARSRRHGREFLLVVLALDRFDQLERSPRARALVVAVDELRRAARRNDVVAHLGNGRFALLLTEVRPDFAAATTERIAAGLSSACTAALDGDVITAKFGSVLYQPEFQDSLSMLAEAEMDLQRRNEQPIEGSEAAERRPPSD